MKILCLNKHYIPIRITTVFNAIGKMYCGMAEAVVVDSNNNYHSYTFDEWLELSLKNDWPDNQKFINAVRQRIAHPSVIRYVNYDKVPKVTLRLSRQAIYSRDDNHCYICGKRFSESKLSIDHITPLSRGGSNSWTNCITCCKDCNLAKGSQLLSEMKIKPKFTAYKPAASNISRLKDSVRHSQPNPAWAYFGL